MLQIEEEQIGLFVFFTCYLSGEPMFVLQHEVWNFGKTIYREKRPSQGHFPVPLEFFRFAQQGQTSRLPAVPGGTQLHFRQQMLQSLRQSFARLALLQRYAHALPQSRDQKIRTNKTRSLSLFSPNQSSQCVLVTHKVTMLLKRVSTY